MAEVILARVFIVGKGRLYVESREADGGYMNDASNHFLGYRVDGHEVAGESAASIYVAYNGWSGPVTATLPPNQPGMAWYRAVDTAAWNEASGNIATPGSEARMDSRRYGMHGRTVTDFVEKPAPVATR